MSTDLVPIDGVGSFVDGATFGFPGFSGFRMSLDGTQDSVEMPHTQVTVVFQFGDPVVVGGSGQTCGERAVTIGLSNSPTPTRSAGTLDCVEVRLSPVTAFALFGGATLANVVGGPVVDLAAVLGKCIDRAVEQAAEADGWSARFGIISDLFRLLQTERQVAPEVREAWSLLLATGGRASIAELSAVTGWSTNRLRTRFEAQIGMTPKLAARLVRFERAHASLISGRSPVDTAIACGFADQSHLHREVKAFSGVTPAKLAVRTEP
jgi:AraC-like DNA-binding protein